MAENFFSLYCFVLTLLTFDQNCRICLFLLFRRHLCVFLKLIRALCNCVFPLAVVTRISRLFNDAKKILLYTQNDKSYEGYRGMLGALRKLQKNPARKDDKKSPVGGLFNYPLFQLKSVLLSVLLGTFYRFLTIRQLQHLCTQTYWSPRLSLI